MNEPTVVWPYCGIFNYLKIQSKKKKKKSTVKAWKLLSERSQSKKAVYYMTPTLCHYGEEKTIEAVKKISVVGRSSWRGKKRWLGIGKAQGILFHMIL